MTTKIECEHCEKPFKPTRAGQKFCSTRCRMKAAHEARKGDERQMTRLAGQLLGALRGLTVDRPLGDDAQLAAEQAALKLIERAEGAGLKARRR
jgi:hypothetical protein